MARRAPAEDAELPALYAHVHPGLESVAADEIMRDLQGEIKRTERGVVVFRLVSAGRITVTGAMRRSAS